MKIFALAIALLILAPAAAGQTAGEHEVILTWQANNFFPSDYRGKAWATPFSPIQASVTLTRNRKIANLAEAEILWYLDRELIGRGAGQTSVEFQVTKQPGDKHFLLVSIRPPGGGRYESALEIPVLEPRLNPTNNFLTNEIPANSQLRIEITPFFFNIRSLEDLAVKWRIKNRSAEGREITVDTGAPATSPDRVFFVEITANNIQNPLETVSKRLKMEIY